MGEEKIEELQVKPEGQTFDRKSAKIDAKSLAVILVAMANADGGDVAVGIEDDVDRMYREMQEAGQPEPKYIQDDFILKATLRAKTVVEDNVPHNVLHQPSLEEVILAAIKNNDKVTRKEIAASQHISVKTVQRQLEKMRDKVKYEGSGDRGHWVILPNDKTN